MRMRSPFIFLVFLFSLSFASIKVPLIKVPVGLQGLSSGETKIITPNLKRTPSKLLLQILKSNYNPVSYYLSLQSPLNPNSRFLLSFSTNFSGLWLKDKNCYDCSVLGGTPKCSYDCSSGSLFQETLLCDNCKSLSKEFENPVLRKKIKNSKFVSADIEIDRISDKYTIRNFPIILAKKTRNIRFIQADGQIGLRYEPKNKADLISLLTGGENKEFSFVFNPRDNERFISSYLLAGGVDSSVLVKDLQYFDDYSRNFTISLKKIELNGEEAFKSSKLIAIFDLEKNFIGLPSKALSFLLLKLQEKGTCDFFGKAIFCSLDLSFTTSGSVLSLTLSNEKVYSIPLKSLLMCKPLADVRLSNYCFLRVRETTDLILGVPFFEIHQVFFNLQENKIGIGAIDYSKMVNFLKSEQSYHWEWKLYLILSLFFIVILLVILGYLLKKRIFAYSKVKAGESSLNILDPNDNTQANNESFIGGDSFHFEYELAETKRNEANPNLNNESITERVIKESNQENMTAITKKYLFERQQVENEQKDQRELATIGENENEIVTNPVSNELSNERVFDEKKGFNSLTEENEAGDSQKAPQILSKEEELNKASNPSAKEENKEQEEGKNLEGKENPNIPHENDKTGTNET